VLRDLEHAKRRLTRVDDLLASLEDAETLLELAVEESAPEVLDEASGQATRLAQALRAVELEQLLGGEHDNDPAIVTVQAGAGGTEAQDWAEMLLRMLMRYAEQRGFQVSLLDEHGGDEAGIKSASIRIAGPYAFGYLKSESGVHRLVRISPFDANARRHTSFAAVYVTPEIDDTIEVEIDPSDLRVDTFRSSGAGGQHVNTTDSAVRITHQPTGIVVACQNERSQHQNRATAMKMLRARLYEQMRQEREAEADRQNASKKKIEWGSQIRSYVLHPYQMVKDHRTGVETSNVDRVLDGDLRELAEGFLRWQSGQATTEAD